MRVLVLLALGAVEAFVAPSQPAARSVEMRAGSKYAESLYGVGPETGFWVRA